MTELQAILVNGGVIVVFGWVAVLSVRRMFDI